MHDDEMVELLALAGEPSPADQQFRAELRRELVEALVAPRITEDPIDDTAVATIDLDHPVEGQRRRRIVPLLLAAAVVAFVALVVSSVSNGDRVEIDQAEESDLPTPTTTVPVIAPEDACAVFVDATTPLSEVRELESAAARAALEVWLVEIDLLRQRVAGEVPPGSLDGLVDVRNLLRQAIDGTTIDAAALSAAEVSLRSATDDVEILSGCRR